MPKPHDSAVEYVKCVVKAFGGPSQCHYKVWPFGSYIMGTMTETSDVDIAVIGTHNTDPDKLKEDFKTALGLCEGTRLKDSDSNEISVGGITSIDTAFVPIVSFTVNGVPVDVSFSKVPIKELPDDPNDITDDMMKHVPMKDCRSINGVRIAHALVRLVPSVELFQRAIFEIKTWAKSRNIYSNKLGYFGGVTWCILVAKVCIDNPTLNYGDLVLAFFRTYSEWSWPNPVSIIDTQQDDPREWDPRSKFQDGMHLLPVLTPVHPCQNTTHNVNTSSKKIILEALKDENMRRRVGFGCASVSKDPYRHFVCVKVTANTPKDLKAWSGFVESRLRNLVSRVGQQKPALILDSGAGRPSLAPDDDDEHVSFYIGMRIPPGQKTAIDIEWAISTFKLFIMSHDMCQVGMELEVSHFVNSRKRRRSPDHPPPPLDNYSPTPDHPQVPTSSDRDDEVEEDDDDTYVTIPVEKRAKQSLFEGLQEMKETAETPSPVSSPSGFENMPESKLPNIDTIVVDGANLAWNYGDHEEADSAGIFAALGHEILSNRQVIIFVPRHYMVGRSKYTLMDSKGKNSADMITYDRSIGKWVHWPLFRLQKQGIVRATGKPPEDDRQLLEYAKKNNALVLSNDLYRDHVQSGLINNEWLKQRQIHYYYDGREFVIKCMPCTL
jgi:poly(A) polymerase